MTKFSHPAWLISAAILGSSAAATVGVLATGCNHSGSLAQRVFGASTTPLSLNASPASPMGLANAALPRLAFGSLAVGGASAEPADVPVDQLLPAGDRPLAMNGLCPPDMASIDDKFCVDKYEASLVEVMPNGEERAFPYYKGVEGHVVRAVSEKGVYPQGYISEKQAIEACGRSAKRLCKPAEWKTACKGPDPKKFGYSDQRTPGTCNDTGKSPVGLFYGAEVASGTAWQWDKMNDPQLNQMAGGLAETGSHEGCTNGYGVHDMVGNLHEWVLDPDGTFQGGYYLDVTQNGDGCGYRTDAHAAWYHDYSTGFRCCSDVAQ